MKLQTKTSIIKLFGIFLLSILSNQILWGQQKPLHLAILLDASASMRTTDPNGIRKLAAQAVISLLSENDQVAVLEFDSDARVLSRWRPASERRELFEAINKASDNGAFTDFCLALKNAVELFDDDHSNARKVILLLSDGRFEPNPYSALYAPYYLQYRKSIIGKNRSERREITKHFYQRMLPKGNRIIYSELVPALTEKKVEIYSIAFSRNVDTTLMESLAESTSQRPEETHYFFAQNATDLMASFLSLLHYWENKIILYADSDTIIQNTRKSFFIDRYISRPLAVLLTQDNSVGFVLQSENGNTDSSLTGTHGNLKIIPFVNIQPPSEIKYYFTSGVGQYKFLLVGESTIFLSVEGLQKKYNFGESVECAVKLGLGNRGLFHGSQRIIATVFDPQLREIENELTQKDGQFLFSFRPQYSGDYRIRFTAYIRDQNGRDLLPRPSREYKIKVMPRVYLEPLEINFGDVKRGKSAQRNLILHNGLLNSSNFSIIGRLKEGSRCFDKKEKLPQIITRSVNAAPGQRVSVPIELKIPDDGCWGDFNGDILLMTNGRELYRIGFFVHVPSLWEYLTYTVLVLVILSIIIIAVLVYLWGTLGKPVGVLQVIQTPLGIMIPTSFSLSQIKRKNLLSRIFNWRRNRVTIGGKNCDIDLPTVDMNLKIELLFVRWNRGTYLFNKSPNDSEKEIKITKPSMMKTPYLIRAGQNITIEHNTIIEAEGYKFRYLNY